ncbi:lisH domain-containing protein [Cinnamomum micranthum f. kanehirae]|uniref:LisH domain-containing protein n=1 Tax=Cinnamomum micranthum f. kanehirae TaxID=337451 RepID=A0A3S3MEB7_9MAGN|nr:lisH domain-containing protein [Cinnamomum micranthum f. kanehirae]
MVISEVKEAFLSCRLQTKTLMSGRTHLLVVPDALRHYYYEYLSSTAEAAQEKIAILRERESLLKANEMLNHEKRVIA